MKKYNVLKETGIDTFGSDFGGRPSKLDGESTVTLCHYLNEGRTNQNAPTPAEFEQKIREEAKASSQRKGYANDSGELARKTLYNIKQAHKCVEGKCQMKTKARIINEADPRNAYTMICMLWAFCSILHACMCFNWDATQFFVSPDSQNTAVYIKGADDCGNIPLTRESSGNLGLSIKYYHLHNAQGETAPPVYVIADDSLREDDFFVLPITGLGNGTNVGSQGYLCWCKTRNCNDKFYRWFAKEIVVPFVRSVRDIHDPRVSRYNPSCHGNSKFSNLFLFIRMMMVPP